MALPGLRCKDNNKNGIYQRSFRKITSGRICSYVGMRLLLHRDVGNATSGRNFCCIVLEVFREKFWRLGDKVLSLPSDSKTNNQTEL